MSVERPDWTTLNAYVDGELSSGEAAAVARAAGADANVAEQIAVLYKLKGGVLEALPPAPDDLAALLSPPAAPRRTGRLGVGLAAACLVCALALGGLWAARETVTADTGLLDRARILHAEWLAADTRGDAMPTPAVFDMLSSFGRLPIVPDLTSTGLDIVKVSVVDGTAQKLLHVAYRGHHGCHLSLFVASDTTLPGSPVSPDAGLELVHSWQAGELSYMLYALGMDQRRFDLISQKVERATRDAAPLDALDRQQLAANSLGAAPCHA